MKNFLARIHWPGLVAFLTTVAGIVTLPEISGLLPAKSAATIIGIGAAVQAVTKAVQSKGQAS